MHHPCPEEEGAYPLSMKTTGTRLWCITRMPDIPKRSAFVLPGAFYGSVVGLMAEAGYTKANSIEEADVVVFIGGSDINPSLYDQRNVASGGINTVRDDLEVTAYKTARALNKVCFGICRGAQFLHAMNGGKLWQDVNNHGGRDHFIVDIDEDVRVLATSLHHQMLQPNGKIEVIAVTEEKVATHFRDDSTDVTLGKSPESALLEIEAGAYSDTKCFFVQGHPEIGSPEYRAWTMSKLEDLILDWTNQTRQIADVLAPSN